MKKISIIGGGFSGTMLAVHLINNAQEPFEINIINQGSEFNKGLAYNPYSKKQLLNVPTEKMSVYQKEADHFLNWVCKQEQYKNVDRNLLAISFLPRALYGDYLCDFWREVEQKNPSKSKLNVINAAVVDLNNKDEKTIELMLNNGEKIMTESCVIATGNIIPRNPTIYNMEFYNSKNYFRDPWSSESVSNIASELPILIVGNGLTMVDTVIGLQEKGSKNAIISISPNGFNILPHRHGGLKYTKLVEELNPKYSLRELVSLVNKHIKEVRKFGVSAEPVIDSLRPYTPQIWQNLKIDEKRFFLSKLRHLWGVARHRIPTHIFDKIQKLRIEQKLFIYSGKLIDLNESEKGIEVRFYSQKEKMEKKILVSRVINCTGPETDINRQEDNFLKRALDKGIITQDEFCLGLNAHPETYEIIDKNGNSTKNIFTIGSNLKGIFWESTAVNELRQQAEKLANHIINQK